MHRLAAVLLTTLLIGLGTHRADAHHIWIEQDDKGLQMYFGEFGDNLREASPDLLDRFVQVTASHVAGSTVTPLSVEKSAGAFVLSGKAGAGDSILVEETRYPIMERKAGDQTIRTLWVPAARYIGDFSGRNPGLTFDIIPIGQPGTFKLVYKGQPLAKTKVEVIALSGWTRQVTTDAQGVFTVLLPWKGLYAIEARHTDRTPGSRGDEKYDAASFVTTLTFVHATGLDSPPAPPPAKPNR
jgi:uncharacterized GH25 family protein